MNESMYSRYRLDKNMHKQILYSAIKIRLDFYEPFRNVDTNEKRPNC